jgi:hypothetical protein
VVRIEAFRGSVAVEVRDDVLIQLSNPGKSPSQSMSYRFCVDSSPSTEPQTSA